MTNGNGSRHDPAELGELERELLDLIWQVDEISADSLRVKLNRPLKDSTVRTVLRRLEEKGYVTHSIEQRTFLYKAAQSRQTVAVRAVKRIADWFCEGSMEGLMVGMIDSDSLKPEDLQKLSARIAEERRAFKAGKP